MGMMRTSVRGLGILGAVGLAGVTTACSTVSPEEMETGLASLRADMMEEMQSGDAAVAQRLGDRMAALEQRTAELESDLEAMERDFEVAIQQLEDELRFDVPVYFGFDDATVEEEDRAVLDRFGAVVQKYYPSALITVEGFTDPTGTAEYNLTLGQRRADAVADYLVTSSSVTSDRVRAVSYGEDTARLVVPQEHGPGTAGWQNRRVVLVIDHQGMPPAMEDRPAELGPNVPGPAAGA